jgi:hypothetical protein
VSERNRRQVDVRRLAERLVVGTRVVDDQDAWLDVRLLDLIGERARRVAAGNGIGASELGKLQDRSLTVRTSRQQNDVGRVVDGDDQTSRQHELLPRLLQIDDIDTIGTTLPDVLFHREIQVARANVLRRKRREQKTPEQRELLKRGFFVVVSRLTTWHANIF